jgi:tetratricopeptide (TPR) repeat protein
VSSVWDPYGLLAVGAVAAVAAAWWSMRRADRLACFGGIWFGVLLAPALVLPLVGIGEGMAEHRAYVASCGLFMVLGSLAGTLNVRLSGFAAGRVLVYAAIVVGLLSLGARAVLRNVVWSDPVALWREAASLSPGDDVPLRLLGEELERRGQLEDAVGVFRQAVQTRPGEPVTYMHLGVALAALNRFDEATATFERLRSIEPQSTVVSTGLGAVDVLAGRPDAARARFNEVLKRDPRDLLALQWLALLEEGSAGDAQAALRRCEEIESISPGKVSSEDCIRRNRARLASGRVQR